MTNEQKKNLEDFMSKNEPKFKLKPYEEEILHLLFYGYTQNDILNYLLEKYELKVTRQTLSNTIKFLKKTNRSNQPARANLIKSESCNNKSREDLLRRIGKR